MGGPLASKPEVGEITMPHATLVLGLGDQRDGDDALGPRALAELERLYQFDSHVIAVETRTVAMRLLPLLSSVRQVLVMTAVRLGGAPGTLHRLEWQGRPEDLGPRLPAVRPDGIELLRSLHFWVDPVPDLVVLGVEAESHSGQWFSPFVALAMHPTVEACVAEMRRWGHEVTPRGVTAEQVGA